jgi:beta-lactamase class C
MQEEDMVALAVGVVEHGQIRFLKGYGETFEGSGQPVNANTIFRWASVSRASPATWSPSSRTRTSSRSMSP